MKINMIFASALLFLASCTSGTSEAPKVEEAKVVKKELTLQLYSLRDDIGKDYVGTIKKAGEIGFTSIEAAGYGDGKFYDRTPEEFKSDIEGAGMKVLSSHTARALSPQEVKSKDFSESLKWWDECIDAHKRAGMKYIVAPWMDVPKTLSELKLYCDYYNEIGKRCKDNGMAFGYHNHAHEFEKVEGQVMLDYMLENTSPEYVFFQMDVYWVVRGAQSPVDYFNKYKNRFTLLHLKDNKELGQSGMVGFDAIFKNTDVAGVKNMVVEVEKYNFEPVKSVQISYDYLQACSLVKESYEK